MSPVKLAGLGLLIGAILPGCAKKIPGNTSFNHEKKGFEKELTPDQRKAATKQRQTETSGKP
jgi:hypothetical protein